jgi:CHASE3 domain sensor protein
MNFLKSERSDAKSKGLRMKLSLNRMLITGTAIITISILTVVLSTVQERKPVQKSAEWIGQTNTVLYESEKVLSLNSELKAKSLIFFFSGDTSLVDTIRKLPDLLQTEIVILPKLISDNPPQQQQLNAISKYIEREIDFSNRLISFRRQLFKCQVN